MADALSGARGGSGRCTLNPVFRLQDQPLPDKVRAYAYDQLTTLPPPARYVKPYWRVFALSILGMAVMAATEPLLPALLKPMLDGTFVDKDENVMRLVPIFILVIFLVRGIASFVGTYAISWVGNKLVMDLREEMFRKLLALPTRFL